MGTIGAMFCLVLPFAVMIGAIVALTWNRDELWRMVARYLDQR